MKTALEVGQQRELSPRSASGAPPRQRDCCLQGGARLSEDVLVLSPFSCCGGILHFLLWKRFADILCCHSVRETALFCRGGVSEKG